MYTLVRELDRMDNDLLWLCLVGVTDQYLRAHISDLFYASCYAELTTCVESLNLQNGAVDVGATCGGRAAGHLRGVEEARGEDAEPGARAKGDNECDERGV